MEKKTFIDKVKAMFSEVEKSNDEEVKMVYYTTKEGVEVKIAEGAELVEGTPIAVVGEDGSEIPAPAGEHVIEDKVVTVDEAGIIVSVIEVEVEETEEETPAEPAEEEMSVEEEVEVTEEVEAAEEEVKEEEEEVVVEAEEEVEDEVEDAVDMVKRIEALEKLISDMAEKMSAIDTLEEKFSKLADEPADEEVKLSKATSSKKSNTNALLELAKYRKK